MTRIIKTIIISGLLCTAIQTQAAVQIRQIEAALTTAPYQMESGW